MASLAKTQTPAISPWRISVDAGGTFTDAVLVDANGQVHTCKNLSQPENPAHGVLDCLAMLAASLELSLQQLIGKCGLFIHGSTVATNVILELSGARVGLLVTEGFRDSLEIRRGARENPWAHRIPYPPVMVRRYLRLPIRERIDRGGKVKIPLDEASVHQAMVAFRDEGVESVAICFLNSFLNPAHEQQAAAIIRRTAPELPLSVSSDLAPIMGEYERVSTAVVDAFVSTRLVAYLSELGAELRKLGLKAPLLMLKSNGGISTLDDIITSPVTLSLSGPAAVVGALKHCGELLDSNDLISVEIGGTSCDVVLMENGRVDLVDHLSIGGYALAVPSVEVHTIGAGGGSIAYADVAGALRVGPQGAGAKPGPAAYGLGGTKATVTDAQLVLGRLLPGPFAEGALSLDLSRARSAIQNEIANPLSLSLEQAAAGIIRVADQHIHHAVSLISVERGLDPRRFTMVAGGGAGGLHGSTVGRMLNCRRVYVPRLGGVLCALGMHYSDLRYDFVRSCVRELNEDGLQQFHELLAEMFEKAGQLLEYQPTLTGSVRYERALDLCYQGQQWQVRLELPDGEASCSPALLRRRFEMLHDRIYGHQQPDSDVTITKARLTCILSLAHPPTVKQESRAQAPAAIERRPVFIDAQSGFRDAAIYNGADLVPGTALTGPLVVKESTTTIFAGPNDELLVDAFGNYVIEFH
jgi:N-methylhydantoinase A